MNTKAIAVIIVAVLVVGAAAGLLATKNVFGSDNESTYSVEYNLNGGYLSDSDTTYTKDTATFDLPTPTKIGSKFLGWYTNSDFSGERIYEITKGTAQNVSVWAKWQLTKTTIPTAEEMSSNTDVSVTFTSNSPVSQKKVTEEVIESITPGKTLTITTVDDNNNMLMSWTFDGSKPVDGYTSGSVLPTAEVLDIVVEPDTSKVASAKEVILKFNHEGKLPFESTIKYYLGTAFSNTMVTIQNSNDDEPIGTYLVDKSGYVEFTINHCSDWIITQWVVVTFNITVGSDSTAGGRFEDGTTQFVTGKKYGEPNSVIDVPTAVWKGYTFEKWVDSKNNTGVYDADGQYLYDMTFKAVWSPVQYTISFDCDGYEDLSLTYDVEDADFTFVEKGIIDPQRAGYDFYGWRDSVSGKTVTGVSKGTTGDMELTPVWVPKTFEVTCQNVNDGELQSRTFDVVYDQSFSSLPVPVRAGYSFDGWYLDEEFETKITANTKVTQSSDFSIYAKWSIITYSITYITNMDGAITPSRCDYTVLNEFRFGQATKSGYLFKGWFLDEALTTQIEKITKGTTGNIIIYAKWEPKTVTVTYDANGGEMDETGFEVTYKSVYPELAVPERSYYDFAGWYLDRTLRLEIKEGNSVDNCVNHTIYAKWVPSEFSITYIDNGEQINTDKFTIETDMVLWQPDDKPNYLFAGWYDNAQLTGDAVDCITAGTVVDQVFYAKWVAKDCMVTLVTNGGDLTGDDSFEVTYGEEYPSLETPVRNGYEFCGWYLESSFKTAVTEDTVVSTYNDHCLYAKWNVIIYNVTYHTGCDYKVTEKLIYTIQTGFVLPTMSIRDEVFQGWYTSSDYDEQITKIAAGTTGDIEVWAKWAPNVLRLDLKLDNAVYHNAQVFLTDSQKDSYDMTEQDDGSYVCAVDVPDTYAIIADGNFVTESVQLTESKSRLTYNMFTVSYDVTGYAIDSQIVSAGSSVPEPNVKITGKIDHWYYMYNDEEKVFVFDETAVRYAITLMVKYDESEAIGKVVNISFECGNGSSYASTTATNGEMMPSIPGYASCNGYIFEGFQYNGVFYYDKDHVSDGNFVGIRVCDFVSDTVLTAVWTPIQYTVSFTFSDDYVYAGEEGDGWESSESAYVKDFAFGTSISDVIADFNMEAIKVGYTFEKWVAKNGSGNTAATVNGNIRISPTFTINYYTIAFDDGNETSVLTTKVGINSNIKLETLSKDYYKFGGWSVGDTVYKLGSAVVDANMIENSNDGRITFKAVWVPSNITIHFDANGGNEDIYVEDITASFGDKVELPVPTYSLEGKVAYWWKTPQVGDYLEFLNQVSIDEDLMGLVSDGEITFYANWMSPSATNLAVGQEYIGQYTYGDSVRDKVEWKYSIISIPDNGYTYTVEWLIDNKPYCTVECIKGMYPTCLPQDLVYLYPKLVSNDTGIKDSFGYIEGNRLITENITRYSCSAEDMTFLINMDSGKRMYAYYFGSNDTDPTHGFTLTNVAENTGVYITQYVSDDGCAPIIYKGEYYPTAEKIGLSKMGYKLDHWEYDTGNCIISYYPGDRITSNCYGLKAAWVSTDIKWKIADDTEYIGDILTITVNGNDASSADHDAGVFILSGKGISNWTKETGSYYYLFEYEGECYQAYIDGSGIISISKDGSCLEIRYTSDYDNWTDILIFNVDEDDNEEKTKQVVSNSLSVHGMSKSALTACCGN